MPDQLRNHKLESCIQNSGKQAEESRPSRQESVEADGVSTISDNSSPDM